MLTVQAMDLWYQMPIKGERQDSIRPALMSVKRGQLPTLSESSIISTLLIAGVLRPILHIVSSSTYSTVPRVF
ncbi:hypothetical protein BYT27DRAFT_7201761, partial [Phlegmacium glaucopus]